MKILYPFTLLMTFSFFLSSTKVMACTCAPVPVKIRFEQSQFIFTGVYKGEVEFRDSMGGTPRSIIADIFTIEEFIKGTPTKHRIWYHQESGGGPVRVVMELQGPGSACGVKFTAGEKYLVYSMTGESGLLSTNLCLGTARADETGYIGDGEEFTGKTEVEILKLISQENFSLKGDTVSDDNSTSETHKPSKDGSGKYSVLIWMAGSAGFLAIVVYLLIKIRKKS